MHGAARLGVACVNGALVRVQARIFGQQGRVDVEHLALPLFHEIRSHDPKETGQTDHIDRMGVQRGPKRAVKRVAMLGEGAVIDDLPWHLVGFGLVDDARIMVVGEHQSGLGVDLARSHRPQERVCVRSTARRDNRDFHRSVPV